MRAEASDHHVTDADLSAFLDRYWERAPASLTGANPQGDDAVLLFEALRAGTAADAPQRAELVLWVNGANTPFPDAANPAPGDGDLDAYLARLCTLFGSQDFTLLMANPHLYGPRLWSRGREWVRRIARQVGMPDGGIDTSAFFGRYRHTPFGVHRGQMSVLTFPAIGEKRFLLWPYAYGETHRAIRDSLDVEPHRASALERCAGPGDLLYWPADHWHIAEADGHPTAAWNLGFWWDRPPPARVMSALQAIASRARRTVGAGGSSLAWPVPGGSPAPPPALLDEVGAIGDLVSDGVLDDAVRIDWSRFVSADGFRDCPPLRRPQGRMPAAAAQIQGRIVLAPLADDRLCLAANGHAVVLESADEALRQNLAALAVGETLPDAAFKPELLAFLDAASALQAVDARGAL